MNMFGLICSLLSIVACHALSDRQVYQLPPGNTAENIASRSNGQLLFVNIAEPILYSIDPTAPQPSAKIIYTFPNATGLSGLAETNIPDVFTTSAGTWNGYVGTKGSFSVWTVDFRSNPPQVSMITPIPGAAALNGMTPIHGTNTILISDSSLGAVWALDTTTRQAHITIQDHSFQPNATFPLGINGIRTFGQSLYFASSAQGLYGTVPIDNAGHPSGPVRVMATLDTSRGTYDDFAIDLQGNAMITTHPSYISKVTLGGQQSVLFSSADLVQPTSATFGRGSSEQESTLYISTSGDGTRGGQIVALDGCGC